VFELADVPTVPQLLASAVERFSDLTFLVSEISGCETFAQAGARVARTACNLLDLGISEGDRVVLQIANSPEFVHIWLATIQIGALPVPVNTTLTASELERCLVELAARLIVADDERLPDASAATRSVRSSSMAIARDVDPESGRRCSLSAAPTQTTAADPAAFVYTSGTTSRPKPAIVSHAAYVLSGEAFPSWVGLDRAERLWACMPLFHMNAQAYSLTTAIAHGYSLALSPRFSVSSFWGEGTAFGVTAVNLVGAMLELLARGSSNARPETCKLKLIYAAPAPEPQRRDALETMFRARIVGGYGMTETPYGCIDSSSSRWKRSSVGRARQHPWREFKNDLKIINDGSPARPGDVGELQFRNPTVTLGYWNDPAATAAAVSHDGWLRTGDLGRVDEDGDVILTGRLKEMIRRRGENISPREVVDVLLEHPAVADCAVVGVPSDLSEEDVAAAVVLRDGATATAAGLRQWCAERLAPFKVPDRIAIRESLPMTPTMRVATQLLAAQLVAEPPLPR
jgi:carnitine-CoA ligase